MVVKRQKSDANLNGSAVSLTNGSSPNGALIQSVSAASSLAITRLTVVAVRKAILIEQAGSHKWAPSPSDRAYRLVGLKETWYLCTY